MQVEIRELMLHGNSRPKGDVRAETPVRGELNIDCLWTHKVLDRPPVHAHITPPVLESLYNARVIYLSGRNIVIEGTQRAPTPGRRNAETTFRQRWWCRIVRDGSA